MHLEFKLKSGYYDPQVRSEARPNNTSIPNKESRLIEVIQPIRFLFPFNALSILWTGGSSPQTQSAKLRRLGNTDKTCGAQLLPHPANANADGRPCQCDPRALARAWLDSSSPPHKLIPLKVPHFERLTRRGCLSSGESSRFAPINIHSKSRGLNSESCPC